LRFDYRAGATGSFPDGITPAVFADGANDWKFIALVVKQYSPTQIQGLVYVNGVLIHSTIVNGIMSHYVNNHEYNNFAYPYLGAVNTYDEYGGHNNVVALNGFIDNFMIIHKALDQTEIQQIYLAGCAGHDNYLTMPDANNVRSGAVCGFNSEYQGTLNLPDINNVRYGTIFDNNCKTGILDLPDVNNVKQGIIFDSNSKTGTYQGGGKRRIRIW
jgi:hypothetical protein